jgi:hypothetical protein
MNGSRKNDQVAREGMVCHRDELYKPCYCAHSSGWHLSLSLLGRVGCGTCTVLRLVRLARPHWQPHCGDTTIVFYHSAAALIRAASCSAGTCDCSMAMSDDTAAPSWSNSMAETRGLVCAITSGHGISGGGRGWRLSSQLWRIGALSQDSIALAKRGCQSWTRWYASMASRLCRTASVATGLSSKSHVSGSCINGSSKSSVLRVVDE